MKKYGVYGKDGSCLFIGSWEDCSGMARCPGGYVRLYCGEPLVPVGGPVEEPNSAENQEPKTEFGRLLYDYEDLLVNCAIEKLFNGPVHAECKAARAALVKYVVDLKSKAQTMESGIDGMLETIDQYALGVVPKLTGKCYACVAADILGGTIVQTWAEAKSLTEGKLDGRAKKCSSPEQAREWLCNYLDMPDEYAVDCSADRSPVGIRPENIPSGDELAPQDNSDDSPPWELKKDGRPVDGKEDDRLFDKPPWEVKRSKPFPKM